MTRRLTAKMIALAAALALSAALCVMAEIIRLG